MTGKINVNDDMDFDPLVEAYERQDRRRDRQARLGREGRRMNAAADNGKRGQSIRRRPKTTEEAQAA